MWGSDNYGEGKRRSLKVIQGLALSLEFTLRWEIHRQESSANSPLNLDQHLFIWFETISMVKSLTLQTYFYSTHLDAQLRLYSCMQVVQQSTKDTQIAKV